MYDDGTVRRRISDQVFSEALSGAMLQAVLAEPQRDLRKVVGEGSRSAARFGLGRPGEYPSGLPSGGGCNHESWLGLTARLAAAFRRVRMRLLSIGGRSSGDALDPTPRRRRGFSGMT